MEISGGEHHFSALDVSIMNGLMLLHVYVYAGLHIEEINGVT